MSSLPSYSADVLAWETNFHDNRTICDKYIYNPGCPSPVNLRVLTLAAAYDVFFNIYIFLNFIMVILSFRHFDIYTIQVLYRQERCS